MIEEVISDILQGIPVVVIDDHDRENEGDILVAAEKATEENLAFILRHARGLMCLPVNGDTVERLAIPMMVTHSTCKLQTPFTVSIDAAEGISTGMSVADRVKTIAVLLNENSKPEDLARPGHLFPLRARPNLLLERRGHTEAAIELMRLCGLKEMAVICEIMNDDGTMTKGSQIYDYAAAHGLKIVSIEEIVSYVYGEGVQ